MSEETVNPNSVDSWLARIETKLDMALLTQANHGERIAALEKKVWMAYGIACIVPLALKFFGK